MAPRKRVHNLSAKTKNAQRLALKRKLQTPEERAAVRKKFREAVYMKRLNETPEQREERLKIGRIRARQKREAQRAAIARQRREKALERIAKETESLPNKKRRLKKNSKQCGSKKSEKKGEKKNSKESESDPFNGDHGDAKCEVNNDFVEENSDGNNDRVFPIQLVTVIHYESSTVI